MAAPQARSKITNTPAPRAEKGERELVNYRLAERLAQEELATVYRGTHLTLDRPVQVAILRRTDWVSASRFQLAARLAARLSHANILPVIDAGHDDRFGDYIVTARIEGETLEAMLQRGALEPVQALKIFAQVGAVLDYLHEQGVTHRDVRPANIFVTPQSTAYLGNFSLAAAPDTPDLSAIEEADYLTPYSAPEQTLATSDPAPAQDLYSLGALLHHMLAGDLPPAPGTPLPTLAERDAALAGADRVVRRLLAEDPLARFPNAAQAVAALRQSFRKQIDASTDDMEESRWEPSAEWLENPIESVIGALLDHEFLARSRARADALHRAGAIRRVLDRWSRHGFLRRPTLGQLVEPEQIVSYNIYLYELRAHYERRNPPQSRAQPHTGSAVLPSAREPELWEVPVPTLEPFQDAPPEAVFIPGSQRVVPCTECNGSANMPCKTCASKGMLATPRKVKDSDGNVRNEIIEEKCPTCHGYGRQPCVRCNGAGQMLQDNVFEWSRFGRRHSTEDEIGGLHKITLDTQAEQVFQDRIDPYEARWHQVAPLHEMIEQAIKDAGTNARLIAAELVVRGVPVTEVDYQLQGKLHSLALIGFKDEVRGDATLLDLRSMALYSVIALLVLAVVLLWLLR